MQSYKVHITDKKKMTYQLMRCAFLIFTLEYITMSVCTDPLQ